MLNSYFGLLSLSNAINYLHLLAFLAVIVTILWDSISEFFILQKLWLFYLLCEHQALCLSLLFLCSSELTWIFTVLASYHLVSLICISFLNYDQHRNPKYSIHWLSSDVEISNASSWTEEEVINPNSINR